MSAGVSPKRQRDSEPLNVEQEGVANMVEEKFRLPDSSYEELVRIIRAYGSVNRPVPLEEITRISGVPRTVVSGNNGFLLSVGIIESGKAKAPTSLGTKLALALEHEMPEEMSSAWREIVQASEFLMKMLAAVRIRRGMDTGAFQGHIAYSAGERRTSRTMTGAKTVIDILRVAGLAREEDGRIAATEAPEAIPPREELRPAGVVEISGTVQPQPSSALARMPAGGTISVHIEIRVEAKPSELEGLGLRLRQVIEEFSGRPPSSGEARISTEP